MAILNYTTQISAEKTASEIQIMLVKAKASAVLSEYGSDGVITHISFRIVTPHGLLTFRLPANIDGVFKALKDNNKVPRSLKTRPQASRVAWRIVKDWVAAQLAIIEAEMATLTQVFLPYAQTDNGETVYEKFLSGGLKQLGN